MALKNVIDRFLEITAQNTFLTVKMRKGEMLAVVAGVVTGTTVTVQLKDANGTFVDVENGSFVAVAATKRIVIPADIDVQIGVKTGDKGAGDPIVSLIQG